MARKDTNQNENRPDPRVPTWVDIWARCTGIDVRLLVDERVLDSINNGSPYDVIEEIRRVALCTNDTETVRSIADARAQLELVLVFKHLTI